MTLEEQAELERIDHQMKIHGIRIAHMYTTITRVWIPSLLYLSFCLLLGSNFTLPSMLIFAQATFYVMDSIYGYACDGQEIKHFRPIEFSIMTTSILLTLYIGFGLIIELFGLAIAKI